MSFSALSDRLRSPKVVLFIQFSNEKWFTKMLWFQGWIMLILEEQ